MTFYGMILTYYMDRVQGLIELAILFLFKFRLHEHIDATKKEWRNKSRLELATNKVSLIVQNKENLFGKIIFNCVVFFQESVAYRWPMLIHHH
jgi:hypothetical protein